MSSKIQFVKDMDGVVPWLTQTVKTLFAVC